MIAWLSGEVIAVQEDHLVLNVQGVGYRVFASDRDLANWPKDTAVAIHIHTVVREDAILLYGFASPQGREMYRALTSVPGVGPKSAMALLSTLAPAQIAAAVALDRAADLTKAKGIGKRLAETIVVKLKDRLPVDLDTVQRVAGAVPVASGQAVIADVLSALANLGYRANLADAAVAEARKHAPDAGFDDLLKRCLSSLRRPG